jgi:hypothetical protein
VAERSCTAFGLEVCNDVTTINPTAKAKTTPSLSCLHRSRRLFPALVCTQLHRLHIAASYCLLVVTIITVLREVLLLSYSRRPLVLLS